LKVTTTWLMPRKLLWIHSSMPEIVFTAPRRLGDRGLDLLRARAPELGVDGDDRKSTLG